MTRNSLGNSSYLADFIRLLILKVDSGISRGQFAAAGPWLWRLSGPKILMADLVTEQPRGDSLCRG
jgi:hypothetical protein